MKNSLVAIRILLLIFFSLNFIMGVLALIAGDTVGEWVAFFYGATIKLTPQMIHVIRMFGAMNLAFAFLGLMAYLDPVKNRAIIAGASFLLFVRGMEMIIFSNNIIIHFNMSVSRLTQNALTFFVMAIGLLIFRPKKS